ncbi:hypothetical protein B0H16DRAFT_1464005 [Mycena metata]|uniref:Uncharacterized protein n=1 Tax=Mycena metata TaxID=1033252 RepID=A0AAD7N1P0_9AGAR|nr:hypothetical protein B0H16DRAFT_1464005 [Mycena metata]
MAFWLGFGFCWLWPELALAWPGIHRGQSQSQTDFPAKSHGPSQAKADNLALAWLEIFRGQGQTKKPKPKPEHHYSSPTTPDSQFFWLVNAWPRTLTLIRPFATDNLPTEGGLDLYCQAEQRPKD